MNTKIKKKLNKFHPNRDSIPFLVGVVLVFFIASIGVDFLYGTNAASSTSLSISPNSASVASGNNITFSVAINPSGSSVNVVQSVLTYNPSNFTLVSATAGSAFNTSTTPVESPGSVGFIVTTTGAPVTTDTIAENVTLRATGAGTSSLSLSAVCPAGNFATTCSAAYDSVTNNNDLGSVSGASYNVTGTSSPAPTPTPTPTPTPAPKPTPTKSTSSSNNSMMDTGSDTSMTGGSTTSDGSTTSGSDTAMMGSNTSTTTKSGQTYAITINVVDSKQKPVKGAKVTLNGKTVTTNSAGVASISAPAGTYTYKVTGSGIQPYSNSIDILPTNNQQFEAEVKTSKSSSAAAVILIIVLLFVLLIVLYIWIRRRGNGGSSDDYSSDDQNLSDSYDPTPTDTGVPPNIITPSRFSPGQERSAPPLERIYNTPPPQQQQVQQQPSAPVYGGQVINPAPAPVQQSAPRTNAKPPTTLVIPH